MKLQIRPTALEDLAKGRGFYDLQELGVGDYFFDSVFADIDSLKLYAGIHPKVFGFIGCLRRDFPTPFTMNLRIKKPPLSGEC
ncbi:MAG: hypothetical protein R6U56_05965 [Opitutales bacterium]